MSSVFLHFRSASHRKNTITTITAIQYQPLAFSQKKEKQEKMPYDYTTHSPTRKTPQATGSAPAEKKQGPRTSKFVKAFSSEEKQSPPPAWTYQNELSASAASTAAQQPYSETATQSSENGESKNGDIEEDAPSSKHRESYQNVKSKRHQIAKRVVRWCTLPCARSTEKDQAAAGEDTKLLVWGSTRLAMEAWEREREKQREWV